MARQKLQIKRTMGGVRIESKAKVLEEVSKPPRPLLPVELKRKKLMNEARKLEIEDKKLASIRFVIEKIAEDGIYSVKELALHAGCKPGVIEELFKKNPQLEDHIRMLAEKPRLHAKRALAKQMEKAAETKIWDKDVSKAAIDYLKVRGDDDFKGDQQGGGYGGVQINIVGVAAREPVRVSPIVTPKVER